MPAIESYELPDDFDIFYGGYSPLDPEHLDETDIIGAHFMGFSAEAAAKASEYLATLLLPETAADARASAEDGFDPAVRPPIDGALVWFRRAHPELKTTFKMLSRQRASRSDIARQKMYDRIPVLKDIANVARRLLHPSPIVCYIMHERRRGCEDMACRMTASLS